MILTSLLFLAVAAVLLVIGAIEGSVTLLAVSIACGIAGTLALLIAYSMAPKRSRPAAPQPRTGGGWDPDTPPVPGYDDMTEDDVVRLVAAQALTRPALAALLAYEACHQGRGVILARVEEALGVNVGAS